MNAFTADDLKRISEAPLTASPSETAGDKRLLAEIVANERDRASGPMSAVVLAGSVRFVEALGLTLTGLVIHFAYLGAGDGDVTSRYIAACAFIALGATTIFQSFGAYATAALRTPLRHGVRLLLGWTLVLLIALAVVFFFKLEGVYSRVWLAAYFICGLVLLGVTRIATAAIVARLTRRGMLERRAVIVGGGPAAETLLREIMKSPSNDLRIYGVFDDRHDQRSPDIVAGFPKLGNVDDLVDFARALHVDLIIFTLPITAEQRILQMLRKLWVLPVDIRLASHINQLRFRPRAYSYVGGVPVIDVFDKPIADWDVLIKMVFDRIVGALALIALSPVLLATAIAVKLDSRGPILFKQRRYGFNNELIEVYKFRSMYVDQLDQTASRLVTKGDPRVTRVGRFIRKTSIDELPQLFNVVFRGNLSLVGPRPHAVHAKAENQQYEQVVDGYFARHRMRPGITGWAQINGWRGETDTQEKIQRRVECDLYYIENWSLLLDIYILLVTPIALAKTENAY